MESLQGGTLALEHHYTIETARARVGFVSRYEATQSPFDVPVWVDVFDALDDVAEPEPVVERLNNTARKTAALDGEGILPVLDYGELDKHIPFIVSERVRGPSLAEVIDEEPLTVEDTGKLVVRLANILERAHNQDTMHGRLAPRWIFLPDGDLEEPKIGHFEIGPTLGELRRMNNVVLEPDMVDAFPPEAFERPTRPPDIDEDSFDAAREFTVVADTYALGLTCYMCLVGEHPFFDEASTDASDGIARVQHESPRPPEAFGVDAEVSECVLRALAADPDERWETPVEFARALAERAGVPPQESRPDAPDAKSDDQVEGDLPPEEAERDSTDAFPTSEPPGPASTAMTLAVALLLLTNVSWFMFWYLAESPASKTNIRLDSQPSGASVRKTNRSGQEIGTTPISVRASTEAPQPVDLFVTKPGFRPAVVTIAGEPGNHDVSVHLTPEPSESESDPASGSSNDPPKPDGYAGEGATPDQDAGTPSE